MGKGDRDGQEEGLLGPYFFHAALPVRVVVSAKHLDMQGKTIGLPDSETGREQTI